MRRLPYPGLRAFKRDEADLFFGRDHEVDRIVAQLTRSRFLAVLGASGSGKSSLVRTGLFEALEGGANTVGSAWRIVDCHPGGEPLARLAAALAGASARPDAAPPDAIEEELRAGPRAIAAWCEAGNLETGTNLLILVDQFEELFTHPGTARGDAQTLAALLVEASRSERVPIYIVLTMRSDYFGAAGAYPNLARAISESLFLTPRMLREECREAIVGPASVLGFTITEDLQATLLNDLERFATFDSGGAEAGTQGTRQSDQLPLLQYALNRMWQRASTPEGNAFPASIELTDDDYERIGQLKGVLDQQGRATIDALGLSEESVERVFRALIRGPSVALAVRDPQSIDDIANISGLLKTEIEPVVSAFAAENCQFLRADRRVDISHESLIRQWSLLALWLEREAEAAENWERVAEAAREWAENGRSDGELFTGSQLTRRRGWWLAATPTQAWADRYPVEAVGGGTVSRALADEFLSASQARQEAEQAAERRRRRRALMVGASGAGLVVVAALGLAFVQFKYASAQQRLAMVQSSYAEADRESALKQMRLASDRQLALEQAQSALFSVAQAKQLAQRREKEALAQKLAAVTSRQQATRSAAKAIESNQAMSSAMGALLTKLERDQDEVGKSAYSRAETADRLIKDLFPPGSARRQENGIAAERLDIVLGNAVLAMMGSEASVADLDGYAQPVIERIHDAVRTDRDRAAEAWRIKGRFAELKSDFVMATDAYAKAMTVAAANTSVAYQAATGLVRLGETGVKDDWVERGATLCEASGKAADGDLAKLRQISYDNSEDSEELRSELNSLIAAQRCRAEVAGLRLAQNRPSDAQAILDDLSTIPAPKDKEGKDAPEKLLGRLELRARIAELTRRPDPLLTAQAKAHYEVNRGTELASDLYARMLALEGKDDEAFHVRQAALGQREASTGFLLAALAELRRLGQADAAGHDVQYAAPNVGDIKPEIDAIAVSANLIDVAQRIEDRHVPDTPPDPTKSRDVLILDTRNRLEGQVTHVKRQIGQLADMDGLLDDREASADAHRTIADLRTASAVGQLTDRLDASCKVSLGNEQCSQTVTDLEKAVDALGSSDTAVDDRFPEIGTDLDDEPGIALNGFDVVSFTRVNRAGLPPPRRGRDDIAWPERADDLFTDEAAEPSGKATAPRPAQRDDATPPREWADRSFLFASEEDREAFRQNPSRYLPAYGGGDPEWIAAGAWKRGDPRRPCVLGDRVVLLDYQQPRQSCALMKPAPALAAIIAAADRNWPTHVTRVTITPELLRGAVSGARLVETIHPNQWSYVLTEQSRLVLPVVGRLPDTRAADTEQRTPMIPRLRIIHSDGSISELSIEGGSFDTTAGNVAPAGTPIGMHVGAQTEFHSVLIWRFTPAATPQP